MAAAMCPVCRRVVSTTRPDGGAEVFAPHRTSTDDGTPCRGSSWIVEDGERVRESRPAEPLVGPAALADCDALLERARDVKERRERRRTA